MSWYCETDEAKDLMAKCNGNECPGCDICISISESNWAMLNHGKPKKVEAKPHPLFNKILKTFRGDL